MYASATEIVDWQLPKYIEKYLPLKVFRKNMYWYVRNYRTFPLCNCVRDFKDQMNNSTVCLCANITYTGILIELHMKKTTSLTVSKRKAKIIISMTIIKHCTLPLHYNCYVIHTLNYIYLVTESTFLFYFSLDIRFAM